MKKIFVIFAALLIVSNFPIQVSAQQTVWDLNSTPKLLYTKALAKVYESSTARADELQRTALIRCNRYVGENEPDSYKCFDYNDNGTNPIYSKGTANDVYMNGMKSIEENWVTDGLVEKAALITCTRKGDEQASSYSCTFAKVQKGDEVKFLNYFRDGKWTQPVTVPAYYLETKQKCLAENGTWEEGTNEFDSICLVQISNTLKINRDYFKLETYGQNSSQCYISGKAIISGNLAALIENVQEYDPATDQTVPAECKVVFKYDVNNQSISAESSGACSSVCGNNAYPDTSALKLVR